MEVIGKFLQAGFEFVASTIMIVAVIMAIVAYAKEKAILKDEGLTALGFGLAYVFAIPLMLLEGVPQDYAGWLQLIVFPALLGLEATGIYKTLKFASGVGEVKG
jgi:hypothetical protein